MYIFLYGSDTFRSTEKLITLKNKYLEKNSSGSDLSILDYEESLSGKSLNSVFSARGLFSEKLLVIVKNINSKGSIEQQKEMLVFLKTHSDLEKDIDRVVIFFDNDKLKKSAPLFKFLSTNAKKQEFEPLVGIKLNNWALVYAKNLSAGASFSRGALNLLLASAGNDLHILANEISKLVNYKSAQIIEEADVNLLVKSKIDSTMFETIEALVGGNKSRALELFHQQIAKGEDVFYILSMYIYQIRTLLKVGDFYWQGMLSAPQIAAASKLHPYVVQKTLSQVRRFSEEKTKQMFREIARIDQEAKIGKTNPVLALDRFIVAL
jgi:DNA polymerase III delta subunit